MGTKENPGEFDCYAAAEPDEPMFVLLGRDVAAPLLVCMWAAIRGGQPTIARMYLEEALRDAHANPGTAADSPKRLEALSCAQPTIARMYLEEALKDAHANPGTAADSPKRLEALSCAQHMVEWRAKRHRS